MFSCKNEQEFLETSTKIELNSYRISLKKIYHSQLTLRYWGSPTNMRIIIKSEYLMDPPPSGFLYGNCTRNHTVLKYMSYVHTLNNGGRSDAKGEEERASDMWGLWPGDGGGIT